MNEEEKGDNSTNKNDISDKLNDSNEKDMKSDIANKDNGYNESFNDNNNGYNEKDFASNRNSNSNRKDRDNSKINLNNFKDNNKKQVNPGAATLKKRKFFKNSLKIRNKLYIFILMILVFNMLATTLFGQTLLEKFYTFNKNRELVTIQKLIKESYLRDSTAVSEQVSEAEKKNITILIFTITTADGSINSQDSVSVEYFSRSISPQTPPTNMIPGGDHGRYSPVMWINAAVNNNVIKELNSKPDTEIITSNQDNFSMRPGSDKGNQSLQIYSKIRDGVYLFLETPQEFIAQTATLAVRYTLYISLFTLGIALVVLAFVSKKITKPILNIEMVANKIASLDFTDRCVVESNDELGQLGGSINRMSETLQENIHRLTVMNAMLREDLEREAQTNKIRREFIANVSHDFKTPLSLITAYSESIRDQAAEMNKDTTSNSVQEEMVRHCDIIISESNKMDGLVNQLLKLSQLENKMVVLQESMFDLTGYVEEVVYQHQILLKAKNIRVEFKDRQERIAYGDYMKIGQVLGNLFENAIKYTPVDGVIKIWITKDDKFRIHLHNKVENVADVEPEQLFVSFYKRDQSRSLEDKSYGLGLAIVKAIVELHGNQCGAYKEDEGLVFWFEVKVYEEMEVKGVKEDGI